MDARSEKKDALLLADGVGYQFKNAVDVYIDSHRTTSIRPLDHPLLPSGSGAVAVPRLDRRRVTAWDDERRWADPRCRAALRELEHPPA